MMMQNLYSITLRRCAVSTTFIRRLSSSSSFCRHFMSLSTSSSSTTTVSEQLQPTLQELLDAPTTSIRLVEDIVGNMIHQSGTRRTTTSSSSTAVVKHNRNDGNIVKDDDMDKELLKTLKFFRYKPSPPTGRSLYHANSDNISDGILFIIDKCYHEHKYAIMDYWFQRMLYHCDTSTDNMEAACSLIMCSLLKRGSSMRFRGLCMKILNMMIYKLDCPPSIDTINQLIHTIATLPHVRRREQMIKLQHVKMEMLTQLWQLIYKLRIVPSSTTYNLAILAMSSLKLSCSMEDILEIFIEMTSTSGHMATRYVYHNLLKAAMLRKRIKTFENIWSQMTLDAQIQPNEESYQIRLSVYASVGHIGEAMKVWKELQLNTHVNEDIHCYNQLFKVLAKTGHTREMMIALNDMRDHKHIRPNGHTYTVFIKHFQHYKKLDDLDDMINKMNFTKDELKNPAILSTLSYAYAKLDAFYKASHVFLFQMYRARQLPRLYAIRRFLEVASESKLLYMHHVEINRVYKLIRTEEDATSTSDYRMLLESDDWTQHYDMIGGGVSPPSPHVLVDFVRVLHHITEQEDIVSTVPSVLAIPNHL